MGRTQSEQCIGAMEAAIKVLTGSGTKKAGFLETLHEAQLMSVVVGVRTALARKVASKSLSDQNMQLMKHFVAMPQDFVGASAKGMSAAQVGQNPFGDYAPQSSQIQGILKGMYDAFTADLEKDNVEEAESQKSFEAIMATKKEELATLEATLQIQETAHAAKTKKLSESEVLLDDTVAQMNADEQFFADTKEACQAKATQWSVRTRPRTEELNGMQTAIKILSSDDAKKTFKASTTTFVQLSAIRRHEERSSARATAYDQLKVLATKFQSRSVAKIAVEVKVGGHFDKVIVMIDEMIGLLRVEEQEDIEHRDRCENNQNANANQIGDLAELLKFRNKDVKDFRQALKDDSDAATLLKKAIVALSEYYSRNKIAMAGLVQKAPEYTKDADKAPETAWSSNDSRKSETGGIVAILGMLVEDTEKEMKEGRSDDADAQDKYLEQNGALQNSLDSQEETKTNTETELADLEEKMSSFEKYKNEKNADKDAEGDAKKA